MTQSPNACPVDAALDVLGGKWKMRILWHLTDGPYRYGELNRRIPKVTEKMLIQQLRALEADGLVHREQYPEVPPRVEYSLTEKGRSFIPLLERLGAWAEAHLADHFLSQ